VTPKVYPVYAVPLEHLHGVSLVAQIRGGPRFEGPEESGLTHFLEHMVFRGAGEHPTSSDLFAAFEEVGDEPEAWTSDDSLVVAVEADPDHLEGAVELLAQVLLQPRFEDLEQEREVILAERMEKVDEDGNPIDLDDLARSLAFADHPLSRSILGDEASIRAYCAHDLERMRARMMTGGNLVVVAAGQVDAARLERACAPLAAIPKGEALVEQRPLEVYPGPRTSFVELEGSPQVDMRFTFVAPGIADEDYPTLGVLHDLLDGGPTSRMPERLVDTGLAYYAQAELVTFPDLSLVEVELSVARERLGEAVQRVLDLLSGLAERVDPRELRRAGMRRRHRARRLRDDARAQAGWHARRLLYGLPSDRDGEEAAADAVTAMEATALARRIFAPSALTAVMLGAPTTRQRRDARDGLEAWAERAAGRG